MTDANAQQDPKYGEPTEVGTALHGDKARAEEHPQPATTAVPADTLIAAPEDDTDTADEKSSGTAERPGRTNFNR
jgi:hypothetical protein